MGGEGWIKLHRRFVKWEWFGCPEMVSVFIYLLAAANHETKAWRGIELHRGQVMVTRGEIASATGVPARSVRTCLDNLVKSGEVTKETTNHYTLITVNNYDRYQAVETDSANQASNQQPTNGQPSANGNDREIVNYDMYSPTDGQPMANQAPTERPHNKNTRNNNISLSNARAYEDWRYVSSAAKAAFNYDADMIADYKRRLMAKQLDGIAVEIGMPEEAKEKFLQRWAEHNPGSETIAAEYENTFDLRDRAVRFMTWWNRNNQNRTSTTSQQPTRSDRFAEGMKRLDALFDGYGKAAHPVDEQ